MISAYQSLGIPDAIAGTVVILCLIFSLAPYAAGQDFGIFKIPDFSIGAQNRLKYIAPILLIVSLSGFFPVLQKDNGKIDLQSSTWKRNYQLFGSRSFPQVTQAGKIGDPAGSGKSYDVRDAFSRDLLLLVLDDEPDLGRLRTQLVELVESAPNWNDRNRAWFLIDGSLLRQYQVFKSNLRAAAARNGVDVEQIERENWVGSK